MLMEVRSRVNNNVTTSNYLMQKCTRFLHACSALCKCANWMCRTCTPHHTVAGRSTVSLTQSPFTFPSNCRCGPPLTSYMPGRAVPSRARVHVTAAHIIAHCALCTSELMHYTEYQSYKVRVHCYVTTITKYKTFINIEKVATAVIWYNLLYP
jgi:hypothetical protein